MKVDQTEVTQTIVVEPPFKHWWPVITLLIVSLAVTYSAPFAPSVAKDRPREAPRQEAELPPADIAGPPAIRADKTVKIIPWINELKADLPATSVVYDDDRLVIDNDPLDLYTFLKTEGRPGFSAPLQRVQTFAINNQAQAEDPVRVEGSLSLWQGSRSHAVLSLTVTDLSEVEDRLPPITIEGIFTLDGANQLIK